MATMNIRTIGELKQALAQYDDSTPVALLDLAAMYCQHFNTVAVPTEISLEHARKPIGFVALTFDSTDDINSGHPIDEYKVDWSR